MVIYVLVAVEAILVVLAVFARIGYLVARRSYAEVLSQRNEDPELADEADLSHAWQDTACWYVFSSSLVTAALVGAVILGAVVMLGP